LEGTDGLADNYSASAYWFSCGNGSLSANDPLMLCQDGSFYHALHCAGGRIGNIDVRAVELFPAWH